MQVPLADAAKPGGRVSDGALQLVAQILGAFRAGNQNLHRSCTVQFPDCGVPFSTFFHAMVRLGASVIHIFTEAFAVLVLFPLIVKSTCFYPNGDTTSKQIPCNSGGTSVCCDQNWYCLSNGLCVDSRYENFQRVLRGSCTDKGGGGNCPTYCTKSK